MGAVMHWGSWADEVQWGSCALGQPGRHTVHGVIRADTVMPSAIRMPLREAPG